MVVVVVVVLDVVLVDVAIHPLVGANHVPVSELDSVVAGPTALIIATSLDPVVTSVVGRISMVSVTTVSLIFCLSKDSQCGISQY